MQIPSRRGRLLTDRDNLSSPLVAVIDDVLAKHIFPGQDPVGRQISMMILGPVQIVGEVGHVKHWGLDSDDTNKILNQIYFPLLQVPDEVHDLRCDGTFFGGRDFFSQHLSFRQYREVGRPYHHCPDPRGVTGECCVIGLSTT